MSVAIVDFAELGRRSVQAELFDSLKQTGFVRLINHGLDSSLLDQAYQLNQQLFALDEATKQSYSKKPLGHRGYVGFGLETAKDASQPDLKEFWHIGQELDQHSPYAEVYPPNIWPAELPNFKPTMLQLYTELESIALEILFCIGSELGLERTYFPVLIKDGNSILRLIHYPPTQGLDTQNQLRAAAHADINLMTLLVGATDSGLQLLDRQGNWLDVDTNADEIVLDTGDMMALITGGILPATVHRVINPDQSTRERYSMPFFLHPHNEAVLTPLMGDKGAFKTLTAGEFLQQRLEENKLA